MPQMLKGVIKNTSAQLVGRIVGSLSTLILTLILARSFGSQGYGEFIKMTTFVSFFYLFADFGFNAIYIQRSEKSASEWSTLLGIRLVLSVVLIGIALVLAFALPYGSLTRMGIIVLLPTILFQALITTSNGLFQKLLRYEWSAISIIVGSFSSVAAIGILFYANLNSLLLLSVVPLLIGSSVTVISSLFFVKKSAQQINFATFYTTFLPFVYTTIPLGLTLIFNVIYFHIDSIVLTFSRPTAEVGIYGLAYKIFELTLVLPTFFMNSVYPSLVRESPRKFISIVRRSAVVLFLMSVFLMIILFFGAPLVSLIRPDFFSSISALRILSLGLPFFFLSSLCMWVLIARKKQWNLVWIYGTTMILNIILNVYFVPTAGYIAAAWITVFCEGLVLAASGTMVLKRNI